MTKKVTENLDKLDYATNILLDALTEMGNIDHIWLIPYLFQYVRLQEKSKAKYVKKTSKHHRIKVILQLAKLIIMDTNFILLLQLKGSFIAWI